MPSFLELSNLLLSSTLISSWRSSTSLFRHDGVLVFCFFKSNCCSSPGPGTFVFDFAQPRCCCSSLFGETDSCLSSCQDSGPPSQIAASCYVESCSDFASLSRRPVPLTTSSPPKVPWNKHGCSLQDPGNLVCCAIWTNLRFWCRHDLLSFHAVPQTRESATCAATLQKSRLQTTALAGNLTIVHAFFASVEYIANLYAHACWNIVANQHW